MSTDNCDWTSETGPGGHIKFDHVFNFAVPQIDILISKNQALQILFLKQHVYR